MKSKIINRLDLLQDGEHRAKALLQHCQEKGTIKKCYHAITQKHPGGYAVECRKGSFEFDKRSYSQHEFLGCPKNCLVYQVKWKGFVKNCGCRIWFVIKTFIRNRWHEFLKLSSWERLLIVALIALAANLRPIYEIIMSVINCKLP